MGESEVVTVDAGEVAGELLKRIEDAPETARVNKPEVKNEQVLCNGRYDLYNLLNMYEMGKARLHKSDHGRWRATFAAAASTGGIWSVKSGDEYTALAVYWRTKNPHVNLKKEVPRPVPDGNYVYVAWMWSEGDCAKRVIKHVMDTLPTVEFMAWHDQREKWSRKDRGQLYVMEMPEPGQPDDIDSGVIPNG